MRIAFFSDIHANLPALQAFFEDVVAEKPDMIYCLGDLVGYNVWANEVVEEIKRRYIPTIMGNHDEALLLPPKEGDRSNRGITRQVVTEENRDYLVNLPRHLKLSFDTKDGKFVILLVHGSPKAINDYLVEDYPESEVLDMLKEHDADMIFCGHTHKPYHRILKLGSEFKHVVNIGSVGKPKDGDSRICYATLSFDEQLSSKLKDSVKVEFKRRVYDIEKAVDAISKSDFLDSYGDQLRQAI